MSSDNLKKITPKVPCPKCGRNLMGQEKQDKTTGLRLMQYTCPACGHTEKAPKIINDFQTMGNTLA